MSRTTRYIILGIISVFTLLTIIKSFTLTSKYGGADLRTRIVASRLITTPHSPYFYKWNPEDGEYYLDPLDMETRLVNGNVVTPAVLFTIYPLARMPYPAVRMLWTMLLVLAGLATVYMLCKIRDSNTTIIASSFMLLGLVCSDTWLYNIERGQMYIFYTFLLALMYRCYTSTWKYSAFVSGFIGGFFILFRPFAAVIGIGFLLHGKWKWVLGCITGLVLASALFILPKASLWPDYYAGMKEYVAEHLGYGHTNPQAAVHDKPVIIEGATNLTEYTYFNVGRLDAVSMYLKQFGISIDGTQSLVLYIIVLVALSVWFFMLRKKSSPVALFLFAFLLFILGELFSATPRGAYNVIQWLFPLSIICVQARYNTPVLVILATGLLLLHHFPYFIPMSSEMAELLFLALTAAFIFLPGLIKKLQHGFSRA